MDRATPYFPPNYVTLKQLHDQRLKEKHDAEEAERHRRKLEEEAEQARKLEEEAERQRRKLEARKLDQQKQDEEHLRTRRSKKPNPRKHAAVIIAEGNPEDSAAAVEPKKGNRNKKGKAARNGQNSLVAAVAEGFGDLTVDGGAENAALSVRGRGGKGRGRNRRTEGSARLCWRAVCGPGVECGIKPNVMPTVVQELGVEAEGSVESGGVLDQVAAIGEESKGNAVDRNVEVIEDVAVTGDNGACVDGKAAVAGRGKPRRWARRRVKAGSRPIDPSEPNQAVEDNETQEEGKAVEVEKGMPRMVGRGRGRNSGFRGSQGFSQLVTAGPIDPSEPNQAVEDNETQEEGNVVEVEKGMPRMVGRGRGRNSGFRGSQGFSQLVTAGCRSSDGMVWVKKTVS